MFTVQIPINWLFKSRLDHPFFPGSIPFSIEKSHGIISMQLDAQVTFAGLCSPASPNWMDISWYIHLGKWNHISPSWILRPWMGVIPLINHDFQWGRKGSVVMIYPDPWYINPNLVKTKRCFNGEMPIHGSVPSLIWIQFLIFVSDDDEIIIFHIC